MRAQHRREPPPRLSALLAATALVGSAIPPASAAPAQPSPPTSAPTTSSSTPDTAAQAQAAKERYANGDFVGSARAYEALWESTHAPKYIYNAGMAREAAGQRGLAVRHWRRFLATADVDITPAERVNLRARADDTAAENPRLEVQLEPASALGPAAVITLHPPPELVAAGVAPIDLRDPVAGDVDEPSARFKTSLDPGTWTLSLTGLRGAADQTLTIELPPGPSHTIRSIALTARRVTFSVRTAPRLWLHSGADLVVTQGGAPLQRIHLQGRPVDITAPEGPLELSATADGYHPTTVPLDLHLERPTAPLTLRLKLDPRTHLRTRLGLGLGLGLPGLALLITGSTIAAGAANNIRDAIHIDNSPLHLRDNSAFSAGVGGGLLLSSVLGIVRPRSARLWIPSASLGGLVALAGLGAYGGVIQALRAEHPDMRVTLEEQLAYSDARSAASSIGGLGIGLLSGSLIGLATHLLLTRKHRRAR